MKAGWKRGRLRTDVIYRPGTHVAPELLNEEGRGTRYLRTGDVYRNISVEKRPVWIAPEHMGPEMNMVQPEDMVVCMDGFVRGNDYGTLGYARAGLSGILGPHLWTIQARRPKEVSSRFLGYVHASLQFRDCVIRHAEGSTVKNGGRARYHGDYVYPSLDEQKRIVAFLDSETARIDRLIAAQEQLVHLLDEKRQAVVQGILKEGLECGVRRRDSGIGWFGDMPEHWEVQKLRRFARPSRGSFTDGDWIESPHIASTGIRLLQTGNIGVGQFREQGFRYVSEASFRDLNCTEVEPGDILVCRLAHPVGRACLAPELGTRMITSVDVTILKPAEDVHAQFLVHMLSSKNYLDFMDKECRGSTRARVSRRFLASIRFPLPPREEQAAISAKIDRESRSLVGGIEAAESLIELLAQRKIALVSRAVMGEVEPGGYDD